MFKYRFSKDFNGRRVNLKDQKEIQPQEIFLDKISYDRGEIGLKMNVSLSARAFYLLFLLFFSSFLILGCKSFSLQVVHGEDYYEMAQKNKFAYKDIESSRGIIYDRNMNQLVFNRPKFSLVYTKSDSDQEFDFINELSKNLNLDYDDIVEKINNSKNEKIVILEDINQKDLIFLEIKTKNLDNFEIEKKMIREYDNAEAFSHLIGYTGKISPEELSSDYSLKDYIGKTGLEKFYEDYLRINPGKLKIEKDAVGRIKSEEVADMAESGNSLVLWIDAGLQKKSYESLENMVNSLDSKGAVAIAINPKNGGVLAMVSYPGFDSNAFARGISSSGLAELFEDNRNPLFNRAVSGTYPAGSTIKPIIGTAVLEEELVSPEKQFYSSGQISVTNPWNPSQPSIFRDWQAHGWVDLRRAIAVSSNVYFYTVGGGYGGQKGLGAVIMKKYLEMFGWNSKTGIDIPQEKEGFLPDPDWKKENIGSSWTVGDDYNMSIGQGYMFTTPIEVVNSFVAIANRGTLYRPMILKEVLDNNGQVIEKKEVEVLNHDFVKKENLEIVREGMRLAVTEGSATTLNSLPVAVAAKTGTAQIPKAGYYHNWVTVFAPYEDPEIVLTVMIEEVEGVRAAALPVAKEILEWYFENR
ncbi:MAG TPA: penicillin-binding protein 2 [Candidatus Pacearchaeota archaeon]|nr:penicillin-binding protein 2 [Candidatus Pacearchaeota archaeon]